MQTDTILQTLNPKRNIKKILLRSLLILIGIALLSMLIFWWNYKTPDYIYSTQEASIGTLQTSISANGTLSPTHEVSIGSVVSGIVLEVLVDVNDNVKQGQILAKIDSESIQQNLYRYEAQLKSAKAQLKSAEVSLEEKAWKYEQLQNLYNQTKGKTPSQLDLQSAKTAYNAALSDVGIKKASIAEIETSIRSTQVDLKNAHITTPINGIVLSRSIEVGQSVAASFQAPQFFIIAENLEEMELKVSISEADIGKVKVGQSVTFSVDSYPNKTFNAVVNRVNFGSKVSTDNIVSYEARIAVDNKDLLLRPGMSATADITTHSIKDALLVPASALYFTPTQPTQSKKRSFNPFDSSVSKMRPMRQTNTKKSTNSSLWILENGIPKEVSVTVGISDGISTQIISDFIKPGTQVILSQKVAK